MPNSKVKASADAKLPPPSISKMNESGMSNIETRPTSIGCHWRASVRSQMRPTTCAMPLSEAIATATPAASLEASNIATRCTAMAPNTTALAATMRLNSNIANRRCALQGRARAYRGPVRRTDPRRGRLRLAPGKACPMQRRTDQQVRGGEYQQRPAPAIVDVERVGDGPKDRRGEATEQGQVRDGPAAAPRRDLHQRRERRVVEAHAHRKAEERGGQIGVGARHQREQR